MSTTSPLTIALDAMGSDNAPYPEIVGAVHAARQYKVRILLIGPEAELRSQLRQYPGAEQVAVEIVPASEVIRMDEKAIRAVRTKRNSTLHVGCRLVREGQAVAFVSAGNTGAVMATAKMILGSLPGVQRPALAAVFPTEADSKAVMLDVGANVDCRPDHLEQFAIMGDIYYRVIFRRERPRVGLLSIGEEEIKGNDLTREAFVLLRNLPLNFVGNVEGRDLYKGNVDVVICDGFVGNVALKISEGLVETIRSMLRRSLRSTLASKVGYVLSRQAYTELKKKLDYTEYGGAPLLGVSGIVTICHGSSNSNAIKNAIRVARESHLEGVNEKIQREIARVRASASGTPTPV